MCLSVLGLSLRNRKAGVRGECGFSSRETCGMCVYIYAKWVIMHAYVYAHVHKVTNQLGEKVKTMFVEYYL